LRDTRLRIASIVTYHTRAPPARHPMAFRPLFALPPFPARSSRRRHLAVPFLCQMLLLTQWPLRHARPRSTSTRRPPRVAVGRGSRRGALPVGLTRRAGEERVGVAGAAPMPPRQAGGQPASSHLRSSDPTPGVIRGTDSSIRHRGQNSIGSGHDRALRFCTCAGSLQRPSRIAGETYGVRVPGRVACQTGNAT
jgi:hypothetical protein